MLVSFEHVIDRLLTVLNDFGRAILAACLFVELGLKEQAREFAMYLSEAALHEKGRRIRAKDAFEQAAEDALVRSTDGGAVRHELQGRPCCRLNLAKLIDDLRGDFVELGIRLEIDFVMDDAGL